MNIIRVRVIREKALQIDLVQMYHSNTTQSKWCIITHILQVDAYERRLFWRALTAFVVYLLFTSSTTLHMGHKLTFISLHFLFEWGCYHAAPCLGLLASLRLQLFCRPQHPAGFFCVVYSLDLLHPAAAEKHQHDAACIKSHRETIFLLTCKMVRI